MCKYFFFHSQEGNTGQWFLCLLWSTLLRSVRFFQNLFLKRVLCIMAFEYALAMKDLLLPRIYFSGCVFIKNICLHLPECQGTPCSKQVRNVKFK